MSRSLSNSRESRRSKSRSSSSSSSSSRSSKSSKPSSHYSDNFSSDALSHSQKSPKIQHTKDELKLKKLSSSTSSISSSQYQDSLVSGGGNSSNLSRTNSLRYLEEEYEPACVDNNLPFNVYQTLFSIKTSMVNVYKLKKQHEVQIGRGA